MSMMCASQTTASRHSGSISTYLPWRARSHALSSLSTTLPVRSSTICCRKRWPVPANSRSWGRRQDRRVYGPEEGAGEEALQGCAQGKGEAVTGTGLTISRSSRSFAKSRTDQAVRWVRSRTAVGCLYLAIGLVEHARGADHGLCETPRIALAVPKCLAQLCRELPRGNVDAALRRKCQSPVDRLFQYGDIVDAELGCEHHGFSKLRSAESSGSLRIENRRCRSLTISLTSLCSATVKSPSISARHPQGKAFERSISTFLRRE